MTDWQDHARNELGPKLASSAFVITINPTGDIDPTIALETGYAVLLDKPIVVLAQPGERVLPGLRRIATKVIELRNPLGTDAGQQQLIAELAGLR